MKGLLLDSKRHRRTNKLRYLDSCVLTDLPTLFSIKNNGDDKPEDSMYTYDKFSFISV